MTNTGVGGQLKLLSGENYYTIANVSAFILLINKKYKHQQLTWH